MGHGRLQLRVRAPVCPQQLQGGAAHHQVGGGGSTLPAALRVARRLAQAQRLLDDPGRELTKMLTLLVYLLDDSQGPCVHVNGSSTLVLFISWPPLVAGSALSLGRVKKPRVSPVGMVTASRIFAIFDICILFYFSQTLTLLFFLVDKQEKLNILLQKNLTFVTSSSGKCLLETSCTLNCLLSSTVQ